MVKMIFFFQSQQDFELVMNIQILATLSRPQSHWLKWDVEAVVFEWA